MWGEGDHPGQAQDTHREEGHKRSRCHREHAAVHRALGGQTPRLRRRGSSRGCSRREAKAHPTFVPVKTGAPAIPRGGRTHCGDDSLGAPPVVKIPQTGHRAYRARRAQRKGSGTEMRARRSRRACQRRSERSADERAAKTVGERGLAHSDGEAVSGHMTLRPAAFHSIPEPIAVAPLKHTRVQGERRPALAPETHKRENHARSDAPVAPS